MGPVHWGYGSWILTHGHVGINVTPHFLFRARWRCCCCSSSSASGPCNAVERSKGRSEVLTTPVWVCVKIGETLNPPPVNTFVQPKETFLFWGWGVGDGGGNSVHRPSTTARRTRPPLEPGLCGAQKSGGQALFSQNETDACSTEPRANAVGKWPNTCLTCVGHFAQSSFMTLLAMRSTCKRFAVPASGTQTSGFHWTSKPF